MLTCWLCAAVAVPTECRPVKGGMAPRIATFGGAPTAETTVIARRAAEVVELEGELRVEVLPTCMNACSHAT